MKITDGDRWIDYTGIQELRGPLAVVAGVEGVGWDEYVSITLADGTERHGHCVGGQPRRGGDPSA